MQAIDNRWQSCADVVFLFFKVLKLVLHGNPILKITLKVDVAHTKWIKIWLTDTLQKVIVNGKASTNGSVPREAVCFWSNAHCR